MLVKERCTKPASETNEKAADILPLLGKTFAGLVRAAACENSDRRFEQNLHVRFKAHILEILTIEFDPSLEGKVAPTANLPVASNARLDRQPLQSERVVLHHFPPNRRSWADERHLPRQYMKELRQFVKACLS